MALILISSYFRLYIINLIKSCTLGFEIVSKLTKFTSTFSLRSKSTADDQGMREKYESYQIVNNHQFLDRIAGDKIKKKFERSYQADKDNCGGRKPPSTYNAGMFM